MHTSSPPLRAALKKIGESYHGGRAKRKALVEKLLTLEAVEKSVLVFRKASRDAHLKKVSENKKSLLHGLQG